MNGHRISRDRHPRRFFGFKSIRPGTTRILLKLTTALVGMRLDPEEQTEGLDTVLHNEKGYDL